MTILKVSEISLAVMVLYVPLKVTPVRLQAHDFRLTVLNCGFLNRGSTMSDVKQSLQTKLEQLEKGLFLMSQDRVRALSTHETVDLIEQLREVVAAAKADANKL